MATTIKKPNAHFDVVTYTGDGASTKTITGLGFQPDFVWIKRRDGSSDHNTQDSLRGFSSTTKISSSSTYGQNVVDGLYTDPKWGYVSAATSDGFTVTKSTNGDHVNVSSSPYVAWCWKASNASAVTNNDGTLTSQVKANQTAGFSVVTWTSAVSYPKTIGHGLGAVPKLMIVKNLQRSVDWAIYHASLGNTKAFYFNGSGSTTDIGFWNDTTPSSTVFTTGNGNGYSTGGIAENYIAYCWAEIEGFSKIGSYVGNGSQGAGPFVYCGFKPKYVLIKDGYDWHLYDGARSSYNYSGSSILKPNTANDELTARNDVQIDMLSNGFRLIGNDAAINGNGTTNYFMAFAESPLKYANAR